MKNHDGRALDLLGKYPIDQPLIALDGHDFRQLFRAAYDWLAHNHEEVNRLNVFPVPDGDTGTNMLLTLKASYASIDEYVRHGIDDAAGPVVAAAAEGAHHGSRGNSGVILGQLLRGMGASLANKDRVSVQDLAEALARGSETAYASVPEPVEGTILTVAREVGAAAVEATASTDDLRKMLSIVVVAAEETVARTPELLPVLKKAGVVDSGGMGLFYFFDGMYRALTGRLLSDDGDAHLGEVVAEVVDHALRKGKRKLPPVEWGFDVQFLVERPSKTVTDILADISAMGDCPLVEGDERLVKVHVHVFDPGVALSYGVDIGFVTDVVVENMDDMAAMARTDNREAEVDLDGDRMGWLSLKADLPQGDEIGLVSVSPGSGFTDIFHDFGVHAVVRGGQTMNPSTEQLVEAIHALGRRRTVILPNNSNILMAARQAAELANARGDGVNEDEGTTGREVVVIPTKTVPQGIAALLAYSAAADDLQILVETMTEQMALVRTGEVTRAVRAGDIAGVAFDLGDIIGLADGSLVLRGDQVDQAVLALLALLVDEDAEIVTLYRGEGLAQRVGENLAEQVCNVYPELDVELAYGGQPHYFYIVSVE